MDINVLREYIVLSQTLNYTKAASALFIQQSTLSKHIASLEKELDVTLLERDHRQVQLTNVGNIFTAAAIEIVNTYDEVLRKIEEVQRYEPLKVGGVVSDPVVSSIMSIANTFLDEEGYPPPEISPNESEGQESLEQLRQGRIDIAVSFAELELLEKWGLDYIPLTRSQFVALVNPENPLSKKSRISLDDLRNFRFIKYADSYASNGWTNIECTCRNHGFTPRTRTVWRRNNLNYLNERIEQDEVLILQANMPQLRFLGDFSHTIVIPLVDEDAVFHLYGLYRKDDKK